MQKVNLACKLIEKLKILEQLIRFSKSLNKVDLGYNHLTISLSIVIEQPKIVKDPDHLETSLSKLILLLKLKNL